MRTTTMTIITLLISLTALFNLNAQKTATDKTKQSGADKDEKAANKEFINEAKAVSDNLDDYRKEYHAVPRNVTPKIGAILQSPMRKNISNFPAAVHKNLLNTIKQHKPNEGWANYKPSEFIKQDYKSPNELQQSIGNAMAYRKTLSPELQAIIPPVPKNYGAGPQTKVRFYDSGREMENPQLRTKLYGPLSQRGIVKDLTMAPDPSNPTPEQTADFNRELKRSYYRQAILSDPKYQEGGRQGAILRNSDVVARAAEHKGLAQQLLGRPIKNEQDAVAATELLKKRYATVTAERLKKRMETPKGPFESIIRSNTGTRHRDELMEYDGYKYNRQPEETLFNNPADKELFIKALPGVARNEGNKQLNTKHKAKSLV